MFIKLPTRSEQWRSDRSAFHAEFIFSYGFITNRVSQRFQLRQVDTQPTKNLSSLTGVTSQLIKSSFVQVHKLSCQVKKTPSLIYTRLAFVCYQLLLHSVVLHVK